MPNSYFHVVALGALAVVAGVSVAGRALAASQDYEFRLSEDTVRQAPDALISVRLIRKPGENLVPDAIIFARRLDMGPDGMPTMTADMELLPSEEPGVYRFRADLGMEGNWRLSLAAKVQGEAETVQSRLVLKATK